MRVVRSRGDCDRCLRRRPLSWGAHRIKDNAKFNSREPGIVSRQNMDLDGLPADKAYRFPYARSPVPIAGATGSTGVPLAIR